MEHSTFVILEIISVISVFIGLIAFIVAKTIENKEDLEDLDNEPVSWWLAFLYTTAPVWIMALTLLAIIILIFAFCGIHDFMNYMR